MNRLIAIILIGLLALVAGLSARGAAANPVHLPAGPSPDPTDFSPTPTLVITNTLVTSTSTPTQTPTITSTARPTPTINPRGAASDVIAGLQAAGLTPAGGRQLFTVPNGYALTSDPGYSFLPLGDGQGAQDFALGFQLGWRSAGPNSACGVRFRGQSADWRSVMFTADGRLMLTHQVGSNLIVNYDQVTTRFLANSVRNAIFLIAVGNTFSIYLDGQLEATVTDDSAPADSAQPGDLAFEVYNPANNITITNCAYYNLWVWSFDEPQTPTPTP